MRRPKPPPLRPWLCDRVHAALVRAGRPVTRGELNFLYLDGGNVCKTAEVQEALDLLIAEGLAAKGEEREKWRVYTIYRATGVGQR